MKPGIGLTISDRLAGHMSTTPCAVLASALIAGILLGRYTTGWPALSVCLVCTLAAAAHLYSSFLNKESGNLYNVYSQRNALWLFVIPLTVITGILNFRIHESPDISADAPYARGVVQEYHSRTSHDVLTVKVLSCVNESGEETSATNFLVNIHTNAALVNPGDIILFRANLEPIENSFDESGYGNFLFARGIDFISNTESSKITVTGRDNSLRYQALRWRDNLVAFIESTPLHKDTAAFICAFLSGDKDALSPETRNVFSAAGLAHILALSGLHVGLLAAILGWLLRPLDIIRGRNLRYLLTITGLILFALFTGLGPSVLRATLMATGFYTALILQRRESRVNILCAAAFGILLFTPRALFDIGFQLSFVCTAAIIILSRNLLPAPQRTRYTLFRICSWIALPCIVFLVSWPLSACGFKTLPILFLPLNLIIIPLLPLFMTSSLVYLSLQSLNMSPGWMTNFLDWIYQCIADSAKWIASHDLAIIPVDLHTSVPCLYLLGIACMSYWLVSRSKRAFAASSIFLAASLCSTIFFSDKASTNSIEMRPVFNRCEILGHHNGKDHTNLMTDGQFECLRLNGNSIVWADRQLNKYYNNSSKRFLCKILVLGPHYEGNLKDALKLLNPEQLILHAALASDKAQALSKEASETGIPVHDLKLHGTYRLIY